MVILKFLTKSISSDHQKEMIVKYLTTPVRILLPRTQTNFRHRTGLRHLSFMCWRKGAGKRGFECTKEPNSKYWFRDGAGKQGFECNKGPISKHCLRMVPESFECAKGPAGVRGEQCSNLIQSIHFAVCTTTVALTWNTKLTLQRFPLVSTETKQ